MTDIYFLADFENIPISQLSAKVSDLLRTPLAFGHKYHPTFFSNPRNERFRHTRAEKKISVHQIEQFPGKK